MSDLLRVQPMTVACPGCNQLHHVEELRRCGSCGWQGVAVGTRDAASPPIEGRHVEEPTALAVWRARASAAGLWWLVGVGCENDCRICGPVRGWLVAVPGFGNLCAFCVLKVARSLAELSA